MPLPIEERIKNLEQQFRSLENQIYYGHPTEDHVFFGVVREIIVARVKPDDDNSQCQGHLRVTPFPSQKPDDKDGNGTGQLVFIENRKHPLSTAGGAAARYDKVYATNVPADWLKVMYRIGDVIKYHQYNGLGVKSEQADLVRGSYVTVKEEPFVFYAEIWPSSDTGPSNPKYMCYPLIWQDSDDSELAGFGYAYVCNKCCVDANRIGGGASGSDNPPLTCKDLAWESDLEDLGGFEGAHPPVHTPFVTKVTRLVNPVQSIDDVNNFTYFFDSSNTDCVTTEFTTLDHANGFDAWQALSVSDKGAYVDVVTHVEWDGTALKQYKRTITIPKCGYVGSVSSEGVTTIDTASDCSCS